MKRVVSFAVVVLLAGGAAVAGDVKERVRARTITEAWRALATAEGHGCGKDLVFDYGDDGGMRNFFCRSLTVMSWRTFLARAPVAPFKKGPHAPGKLNLAAKKDFGRYDPAFVTWATTALIPAAEDAALRKETQPTYERAAKKLARTYYEVWRALAADAAWVERERTVYLQAADRGDVDALGATLDLYHDVLGPADKDWGGHDPNLVRSSTTWWLRRFHDDTAKLWVTGLERLLTTYDAEWLAAQQKVQAPALPRRAPPPTTPEYR